MNDEDIIDLFFDRKESAIFETDNKYGNHLSKLAMRILNCHEDAEECKNDTYFETWNTVPFLDLIEFIGLVSKDCETYLMLKYYYDEENKTINDYFKKEDKLARDIRTQALLLVAFLTNKAVLI